MRTGDNDDSLPICSSALPSEDGRQAQGTLLEGGPSPSASYEANTTKSAVDDNEKEALAKVQEAIEEIDDHEKADYLEALESAPRLVEEKTRWRGFLRFTNSNSAAAAQGIVNYWRRRRQTFKDKWLLPITICRNGAMSSEAIRLWKTCVVAHLPNDSAGRSVICHDVSRKGSTAGDAYLQCLWYSCEIVSRNPKTNTEGFVTIMLLSEFKFDSSANERLRILFGALPVKMYAWHLVNNSPPWRTDCLVLRSLFRAFEKVFGFFFKKTVDHHIHTSLQKELFVEMMNARGVSKEGLPRLLGGTWSYGSIQTFASNLEREEIACFASYGLVSSLNATESVATRSETSDLEQEERKLVQGSLLESWKAFMRRTLRVEIPDKEKIAYLEALECPDIGVIMTEEANIDWFLEVEDFHCRCAAKRYIRYWQLRSETFGPDRFKPLHQTGEGALGRSDLYVLATNFLTLLPNDAMGCPVLSINSSMLKTGRSARDEGRDRCLFYIFSILAESEKARNDGAVIIFRMDALSSFRNIDMNYLTRLVNSLPLCLKAFHIVSRTPVSARQEAQIDFCDQVVVHDSGTWEEILSDLETFGMQKEHLPKYLGGGYGLAMILQWQELRTRIEFRLPLGTSVTNASSFDIPGKRKYTELPEEDGTERRRRLNIVNCRRKRDRVRIQKELLEEECADLTTEQEKLRSENLKLVSLVDKANNSIAQQANLASSDQSGRDPTELDVEPATGTTITSNETSVLDALSGLLGLQSCNQS